MTAAELIKNVRSSGGRPYRMVEPPLVFVLTDKQKLAQKLVEMGAKPFRPAYLAGGEYGPFGAFSRARGGAWNWDLYIHMIPVEGEETIWDAVGPPNLSIQQAREVGEEAAV